MRVYLDIDGTLLYHPVVAGRPTVHPDARPGTGGQGVCPGASDFLKWLRGRHEVRWLTGWCGDPRRAGRFRQKIRDVFGPPAWGIQPAKWRDDKTEALDDSGEWAWFDDDFGPELYLDHARLTRRWQVNVVELRPDSVRFLRLVPFAPRFFFWLASTGPRNVELCREGVLIAEDMARGIGDALAGPVPVQEIRVPGNYWDELVASNRARGDE